MEIISQNKAFGGEQRVYKHPSETCACDMTFGVYLPPEAAYQPVPVLWYLSGLTCTHENAMTKSGFQEYAAEAGLAVVFPDTSPRGSGVADHHDYDLGQGAGFYVNATQAPWAPHFQMYDYILDELRALITKNLPLSDLHGITGHSMGGHGALTIALNNPEKFMSVSALAPIANPTASEWGRKQLSAYLGDDPALWAEHDATVLLRAKGWDGEILIDQGTEDQFVDLLKPECFAQAMAECRQPGQLRLQPGYDHSYFFVASFAGDHVDWHAERLFG